MEYYLIDMPKTETGVVDWGEDLAGIQLEWLYLKKKLKIRSDMANALIAYAEVNHTEPVLHERFTKVSPESKNGLARWNYFRAMDKFLNIQKKYNDAVHQKNHNTNPTRVPDLEAHVGDWKKALDVAVGEATEAKEFMDSLEE